MIAGVMWTDVILMDEVLPEAALLSLEGPSKKMTIGVPKQHGFLYYFSTSPASHSASSTIASFDLWHRRFGHVSHGRMNILSRTIPKFSVLNSHHCDICPLAKQTRLPFSSSSITSIAPFDLLHCDIWGGYSAPSHSGA
ncbi:hypothetical protein HHK36_020873 [Tetracentron sinense]|uniref:GAG-pre-integrase domain-containing protein n=1 Tax=Tetracentron sinense TaxID=13715 RepID=A0A834Z0M4_TETSI|nr:hypothetical protein HHK36_020873 [Tetracentron sinense]